MKPILIKQGAKFLPYDPTPSREDIEVTKRLTECGKMLGIELLDHLIIGDQKFVSLKEKGYV
ncbi:DNA repair protein RadC [Metabacillus malikii]|uniref:DNA repair protein RadC n=1 Tax=Metabacillus malikii TaxID=1504265 RepID=A0ABT9ZKK4_9BACI|nr:DNA repair protein RadC [Metabacillus malikii]